mmetsp:Transcript_2300/g.4335  ORF Transcript_2300/g.4335 Transcript_2300/m.4335 type:complete len:517 (-) Transcript_2300:31-1581(-)
MSCIHAALIVATLRMAGGSLSHDNCLLQRTSGRIHGHLKKRGESCAALKNQGSYFSVPLCVGTPAQCFDVVADTGSDAVIVPDCICGETPGAGCTPTDKCFRGTNTSSTFSLPAKTKIVSMTFGSGTIQAAVAKDVVSVGDFKVTMEDGVLLIVNRAQLEIPGAFEGILGLGIPKDKAVMASLIQGLVHAANHAPGDQDVFDDQLRTICSLMPTLCDHYLPLPHHPSPAQHGGGDRVSDPYETKLFLQQAKVDRFSMCFRDGAQTGALRLGRLPTSSPLQNIGKLHWGLNFQGLSVGAHTAPAPAETIFCGPETMKEGMETPCAIIPDSGTTLLTGPAEQVSALEAGICSKWERCQTSSGGIPSSVAFRKLLFACGQWLTKENGLLEIPSMFFHVKSGPGMPEAFELTAWAWVTETTMRLSDGSAEKVCQSSIGSLKQDYITQKNGPVWIFGHPLFYEYNIGYDLSTKQISLQRGQCEPCSTGAGPVSLNDEGGRRWPRASHGEPRVPHYDVNLPL